MQELHARASQQGGHDPAVAGHVGHLGVARQRQAAAARQVGREVQAPHEILDLEQFRVRRERQGVRGEPALAKGPPHPLLAIGRLPFCDILNRDKHPEWNGERTKMIYSFPTNEKLWAKYAEVRAEGLRAERGLADATEFYRQHQEAMDEGAAVAWAERYNYDEISAVQHAMNLKLQDEAAFFAEYQNEPLPEEVTDEIPEESAADARTRTDAATPVL